LVLLKKRFGFDVGSKKKWNPKYDFGSILENKILGYDGNQV
jgi:hypothetical protein